MIYRPPTAVHLTKEEAEWYGKIPPRVDPRAEWAPIADSMGRLFESLHERDAIPGIRLRVFADPDLAEKHSRSPMEIFESNGTCGQEIYSHPHFVPYLHYFINGPNLPTPVIAGFCDVLNEDVGTSGMLLDDLKRYVRRSVREFGLDPKAAATEFYRLAVELGLEVDRHAIRHAARSTR